MPVIAGGCPKITQALRRSTEIIKRQIVLVSSVQHEHGEVLPFRTCIEFRRLRLDASPFIEAGFVAIEQWLARLQPA